MITVWTTVPKNKVLSNLSPVLKTCPELPVTVSNDPNIPGTQLLLALGSTSLQALQGEQLVAKNRTITSLRTQPVYRNGVPVLVSYSPDINEIDHRYYVDLLTDMGMAVRYCQTGSFEPKLGDYYWISDLYTFVERVKTQYEHTKIPVEVMLDLETVGLDPYLQPTAIHPGARIVTIQVSFKVGEAWAVKFESKVEEVEWFIHHRDEIEFLLNSSAVSLRGANLKYDLHWLWVRGKFTCSNFKFDTTLVGSLLDENRSNALDVHCKIYAPRIGGYSDSFDRQVDKSRMDLALLKDPVAFLNYACGDVDGGLEVAINQKKTLLEDPQLTQFYVNILHPAARAFEQIEQGGVCVDLPAYLELKADLEAEQTRLIKQSHEILGGRIVAKHYDPGRVGGINLTKASLLKDFMFSPMGLNLTPKMFCEKNDRDGNKVPSTALEHLQMFADNPDAKDFVQLIAEYGSVTKTYTTYVVGFLEHIRSDGRFHPTYFLFAGNRDEGDGGTNTGRLSTVDPAWQTIPKHTKWAKRIRRCFPAPSGYVVVERDYQAGELRVAACIADETNMLTAFKEGKDVHALTGSEFLKITYEQMMQLAVIDPEKFEVSRQAGKPANFGLLYEQGVDGFRVYSERNYGVVMTQGEAEERHALFFQRYPKFKVYHADYKAFARKNGYVRSPLGRVRHLPLINSPNKMVASKEERRAINSPIQSCLSDMLIWALSIEDRIGLAKIAPAFGACHDGANNYVPEDKVESILTQQLEIQENLPFHKVGWAPQIKFTADAKFGPNMGELEKFKRK